MSATHQTTWVFNEEQLQRALEVRATALGDETRAIALCKTVSEFLYSPQAEKLRVKRAGANPEVTA